MSKRSAPSENPVMDVLVLVFFARQVRICRHAPIATLNGLIAGELCSLFRKPALWERFPSQEIARPTDRLNIKRPSVVSMVVIGSRVVAVRANKFFGGLQFAFLHCLADGGMSLALAIPETPTQALNVPITTPVVMATVFHLRFYLRLLHDLVMKRLQLGHRFVRDALPALPGVDSGNGRLIDAGSALDFLLGETGSEQFGDESFSVHAHHDIANALAVQVQKPLPFLIGLPITIAL